MTKLILIRHGMSKSNAEKTFTGQGDTPLNETGELQAKLTAKYIIDNYKPDIVYASDLQRAFRTGEETAKLAGVDIIADKNLREIKAGEWEGLTFEELSERYGKEYDTFVHDIGNAACSGGENVKQLAKRVTKEIRKIAKENDSKTVVIATHATPIRAAMCVLQNRPIEDMKDIPWVSNASVTVLNIDGGNAEFEKISEDAHLAELVTRLPANV